MARQQDQGRERQAIFMVGYGEARPGWHVMTGLVNSSSVKEKQGLAGGSRIDV